MNQSLAEKWTQTERLQELVQSHFEEDLQEVTAAYKHALCVIAKYCTVPRDISLTMCCKIGLPTLMDF